MIRLVVPPAVGWLVACWRWQSILSLAEHFGIVGAFVIVGSFVSGGAFDTDGAFVTGCVFVTCV